MRYYSNGGGSVDLKNKGAPRSFCRDGTSHQDLDTFDVHDEIELGGESRERRLCTKCEMEWLSPRDGADREYDGWVKINLWHFKLFEPPAQSEVEQTAKSLKNLLKELGG